MKYEMKRRIFEVLETSRKGDASSRAYDMLILVAIIVGMIPLTRKVDSVYTLNIDIACSVLFLIDYIARLYTADYKMGYKSIKAYIAYILTPLAIVDLLSVLPIICILFPGFSLVRLLRLFRLFRTVKLTRYSKTMVVLMNVLRKVKNQLFAVLTLIVIYIIISAVLVFQLEPDLFDSFFDALYWATISITTIGYGDISPVTTAGRMITMVSSLVGMAVIALPTGIITAAYMEEIRRKKSKYEL